MPSAIRFWVSWTHLSRTPAKCKKTAPKAWPADEIRLSIPASQPLPAAFEEYFGDVGDFEGLGRQQRQGLTA